MRLDADLLRDSAEIDPLDTQFGPVSSGPAVHHRSARRRWWQSATPGGRSALLLLPLGVALGPQGLNVLSRPVLTALDPAVSVIVGVLGVLIGLGLDLRRPREGLLLAGGAMSAAVAALVLGGGAFVALMATDGGSGAVTTPVGLAALIGLCGAVSALPAEPTAGEWRPLESRLRATGSVLPIVAIGLLAAWFREGTVSAALSTMAQGGLVALTIAGAAWLLVGQTSSGSEQRVFAAGALLLVSGAAEFLSLSVLFAGLATGMMWQALDGDARDHLVRDTRYAQHPMMAVLLLVAGARVGVGPALPVLLTAYVICRTAGQIAGGWLVRRTLVPELPAELGLHLASPGIVAIAMALDATGGAAAGAAGLLLPVVVFGTLASEILATLFSPRAAPAGEVAA